MTKKVVTVTKDTPIHEAMDLMLREGVSGVPVVEDNMTLVGVLSEKDVVGLLYDGEALESRQVRHFMTERSISFDIEDSLIEICDFLTKGLVRRVPVTSEGQLVGIISVPDIIRYTLSMRQESGCSEPGD
ncbi:MAG: CBS domain-containing protein [Phycisphaerales bacterium]|nr:MAG: CBS domain-containing protein [Phycisphaerales bacterium]